MSDAGKKHDAGKLPLHSILAYFPRALEELAGVIAHGEQLHGWQTWDTIENPLRRYAEADMRHEVEKCKGNTRDADSGRLHRAHRAFNVLALLELEMREQENG